MMSEPIYSIILYFFTTLLALAVGSFLNVVIYRAPRGESLSFPPSHCTSCGKPIKWYDNIPLISFLMLRGKCRFCGEKISLKYPLVELMNAIAWVISVMMFWKSSPMFAVVAATASSVLILVAIVDLEHMIILDRFTLTLAALAVFSVHFDAEFTPLDKLIGLCASAIVFFGVYYGFRALTGREGMGFGDVKLALAAGLLLGWQRFLLALLISSIGASVILLSLRKIRGNAPDTEYPFGPFLSFGIWAALIFGGKIIEIYENALFFIK